MPSYGSAGRILVELVPGLNDLVGALAEPATVEAAQKIAAQARAIAPVGKPYEDDNPGEYKASIHTEGSVVVAGTDHGGYVEFGVPGRGIPAKHTLHDAATSLGYRA